MDGLKNILRAFEALSLSKQKNILQKSYRAATLYCLVVSIKLYLHDRVKLAWAGLKYL